MTADRRRPLGMAGEAAAAAYLADHGYVIAEKNWHCRLGELDIIAARGGIVVFVEVRTRSEGSLGSFGAPLESITPKKQAKLRRCAEAYLQGRSAPPNGIRFDCIGVVLRPDDGSLVRMEHVAGAF